MWNTLSYKTKLLILSGESTVMVELLLENATLVTMIRRGDSKEACLSHIEANF